MTIPSAVFVAALALSIAVPILATQSKTKPPGEPKASAASGQPTEVASHFEKAEALLKAGKVVEAIAEYKRTLEDHPENEAAYFGMALAQAQAGLAKEAVLSYEAALKINPQLWEAEINLGMLLMNQQRFEESLSHFQRASGLNPKSFQSAFFSMKALESLKRWKQAAEAGLNALPLAQDDATKFEVHASLGVIYLKAGSAEEAEKHLVIARQHGADPAIDLELARLYFQKDRFDKSVELLEPLAHKHPENATVQELLGRVWLRQGSFEAAIGALEKALKLQTEPQTREDITFELAQAFQKLNQPDKAIALLRPVASQSHDASLHFHLGALYLQQRSFDDAAQSFLRALQLKPDCVECYSNLGSVFMLQENYAEAITAFSRFKAARPEAAGAYFYLGIAFDKLDDVENAMANYRRFLILDQGKSDKQSFQARERIKVLEKRKKKR